MWAELGGCCGGEVPSWRTVTQALELSPGHGPLLLQVYLGQVRAQNLGSGRDKQLRLGPVVFPTLTFYPQMRTRRNQE